MTRPLTIEDLMYDLPDVLIATHPVTPRPSSKMMVLHPESFEHLLVQDFPRLLPNDALLIVNETAVMPARFIASRVSTGGRLEGLFLKKLSNGHWDVMLKSNGKLRVGIEIHLGDEITLTLQEKHGATWHCKCNDTRQPIEVLAQIGMTPLPPYIVKARGDAVVDDAEDRKRYQTVFADLTQAQSVAAPTAGLHFNEALLDEIDQLGIKRKPVTLHVGAGTFKPIETERLEDHLMHEELWSVSQGTLDTIKRAKESSQSIIAVGTTTVRTLESLPEMNTWPSEGGLSGSTSLMISPPYDFKIVDGLLTNFHLPKSTLLALVAAFVGIDRLKSAYCEAIISEYRFYSYGDAMYIPSP